MKIVSNEITFNELSSILKSLPLGTKVFPEGTDNHLVVGWLGESNNRCLEWERDDVIEYLDEKEGKGKLYVYTSGNINRTFIIELVDVEYSYESIPDSVMDSCMYIHETLYRRKVNIPQELKFLFGGENKHRKLVGA